MLKLFVHPFSTPALSTLMTAHAVGANFDKNIVDLASGEQRSQEYLEINRAGKVPALVDGDFRISESATIMRYLAKREKSDLYPADIKGQAHVDQWMDYVIHHVRGPFSRVQFNRMFAPMLGQPVDEKSVKTGLHLLEESLPIIDIRLSETAYLCGEDMTLADIALLAALDPAEMIQIDLSPYPNLSKWRKALREQDFYQSVHTHYGAELGR